MMSKLLLKQFVFLFCLNCRNIAQLEEKDRQINELAQKLSEYHNRDKEITEENETLRVKSAELEEKIT